MDGAGHQTTQHIPTPQGANEQAQSARSRRTWAAQHHALPLLRGPDGFRMRILFMVKLARHSTRLLTMSSHRPQRTDWHLFLKSSRIWRTASDAKIHAQHEQSAAYGQAQPSPRAHGLQDGTARKSWLHGSRLCSISFFHSDAGALASFGKSQRPGPWLA